VNTYYDNGRNDTAYRD